MKGETNGSMVVELVPLKGGIGSIVHPPIGSIYQVNKQGNQWVFINP